MKIVRFLALGVFIGIVIIGLYGLVESPPSEASADPPRVTKIKETPTAVTETAEVSVADVEETPAPDPEAEKASAAEAEAEAQAVSGTGSEPPPEPQMENDEATVYEDGYTVYLQRARIVVERFKNPPVWQSWAYNPNANTVDIMLESTPDEWPGFSEQVGVVSDTGAPLLIKMSQEVAAGVIDVNAALAQITSERADIMALNPTVRYYLDFAPPSN